jgi:hypothetical protein
MVPGPGKVSALLSPILNSLTEMLLDGGVAARVCVRGV